MHIREELAKKKKIKRMTLKIQADCTGQGNGLRYRLWAVDSTPREVDSEMEVCVQEVYGMYPRGHTCRAVKPIPRELGELWTVALN